MWRVVVVVVDVVVVVVCVIVYFVSNRTRIEPNHTGGGRTVEHVCVVRWLCEKWCMLNFVPSVTQNGVYWS